MPISQVTLTPTYDQATPADGEIFQNTFTQIQTALNTIINNINAKEIERLGEILITSRELDSTKYLLCDGRELSRTDYSELNAFYSSLNYPFGNGDGATTFNIPNLTDENRFIRSSSADLNNLGQEQEDTMQLVQGFLDDIVVSVNRDARGAFRKNAEAGASGVQAGSGIFYNFYEFNNSLVARTSDENRPKNIALAHYIRVKP